MTDHPHAAPTPPVIGVIVEEEVRFSLADLSSTCGAHITEVIELVEEGVLEPAGSRPEDWRFSGAALRRARSALRLEHDLELDAATAALVLNLLDEIDELKSRLRRAGLG